VEEGQTAQWPKVKNTKGQTMIYQTLHIRLKIEQCEPYKKTEMNSGAPKG